MTGHRSNLDHSAANLRCLAFDQSRKDRRGNPRKDDRRIMRFDRVHRSPNGVLRVEYLMAALLLRRQPSLYRTEVDDEVLPLATSDDRRFQLADTVAVPFGAGEHPRGPEARLEYRAGRPRGAAGRGAERNRYLHQIARGSPFGGSVRRDFRLGILYLSGHAFHDVAHEIPFFGVEAGAQGTAATPGSGNACRLFDARDDLGPVHFCRKFLNGSHQIGGRLRSPGRFPNRASKSGARRAATTALQAICRSPSSPFRQRTASASTARRVPVTVLCRFSIRWRIRTRRPRNRRHSSTECNGRSRPGVLTSSV